MFPRIQYGNSCKSDNSPVLLQCKLNHFVKGKGLWKFKNSFLTKKKKYEDIGKNLINQIIHQYSYVYNRDEIPSIENENVFY